MNKIHNNINYHHRNRFIFIIPLLFVLLTTLTGCVKYNVGINFESQVRGEIVQHIKLGKQLNSFSPEAAEEWLNSIEQRSRQVRGKIKHISKQEVAITIPFNNGAELADKFNQFFNPVDKKKSSSLNTSLPEIKSKLSINQNNLLLVLRNRLTYNIDLTAFSLSITDKDNIIVSPGTLLDLEFSLNTPWGARSIETTPNSITPDKHENRLIWTLKPGQVNHIEAVFWLPSPIGIGALFIAIFVWIGMFLKYQLFPAIFKTGKAIIAKG